MELSSQVRPPPRIFSGGSNREVGAFAGAINDDAGSDELVLSVSDLSATFGCFLSC